MFMSLIAALALFGLLTLILIGNEIFFTYATQGFGYGFSANRGPIERSPLGLRIQRSYQNQVESAAYVVPVLAAGALIGLQGWDVELAALLLVIGRAAFALLYYSGIPFIRVPAFLMGTLSTLYIAFAVVTAAMM
jgi:uncharacterized MAPEG superfamily protein